MKKYSSEAFGTSILTFTILLSLSDDFQMSVPVLASLLLGTFVYTLGHVSGAHLNPAITVAIWTLGKITTKEAGAYILAQTAGAVVTMLVLQVCGADSVPPPAEGGLLVGMAELIGAFIFSFGIASVVFGKVQRELSGVVVGVSLLLGIVLASSLGSAGVLNPAVALALNAFTLYYVCGAVVGAVLGMQCYRWLATNE